MLISESIGYKIKTLREYLNISQKNLCDGICSQAYISLVERGDKNISADILFRLSQRLGINIYYFFEYYESTRDDYIKLTMEDIRSEINNRNYRQVKFLIQSEKQNPLFSSNKYVKQFIKWNEGICEYHLEKNPNGAISHFDEALEMSDTTKKNYSERELEIMLSKAIVVSEVDNSLAIEIYEKLLLALANVLQIKDVFIPIRIYYNYSRVLTKNKEFQKSTMLCEKGIVLNRKHYSLYLLGELYFQIALNNYNLQSLIEFKENYVLAEQVFNITGDFVSLKIMKDRFIDIKDC